MDKIFPGSEGIVTPSSAEIEAAKKYPNGWLYRIAGNFSPTEDVPPQAIVGAWQVDAEGKIVGGFRANANYDPKRYLAKLRIAGE